MTKLKFKSTSEEKERSQYKRKRDRGDVPRASSSKRHHKHNAERKWATDDEHDDEGIPVDDTDTRSSTSFPSRAHKPDYDAVRAELEEQRFREKMFDALGDDERLDGLEARLNDFAHVPDRWRSAATGPSSTALYDEDEFLNLNPAALDDEEYAEWVRLGMYRKTHAAEHAERLRRKAAEAERRAADKARRRETRRLERLAEEDRRQKRRERRELHMETARAEYQSRWKGLLADSSDPVKQLTILRFRDIPWPIAAAYDGRPSKQRSKPTEEHSGVLSVEDFTTEAIAAFLLPPLKEKERKERLRESFLRFHPDKFEGRFMRRISEMDAELVRNIIAIISRTLNELLEQSS